MRCFIALPLPAGAREALSGIAAEYRREIERSFVALARRGPPGLSWTRTETYHLTLAFLGEIEGRAVDAASAALDAARGFGSIDFSFAGTGSFPPRAKAWRVLYAALSEGSRTIQLHRRVNEALARGASEAGLPPLNREWPEGRPFSPHITLARARAGAVAIRLREAVPGQAPPSVWTIGRCSLYKSELRGSGSVYTELRGVDLAP